MSNLAWCRLRRRGSGGSCRWRLQRRCHGGSRRIEKDGELAHALAGLAVHFQQQVEVGIIHRHAAGDADHLLAIAGAGDTEMKRDRGAPPRDAGAGEIFAGGQLNGEVLQFRRIGRVQRNLGQQRLPQGRFDLDLAQVQRHCLTAAQCQCHQHRQLQRTIHQCVPPNDLWRHSMVSSPWRQPLQMMATLVICRPINNSSSEYLQCIAAVRSHRRGAFIAGLMPAWLAASAVASAVR